MAIRESILTNIVTTLKTIAISGGYHNDIGLVTREPFNWTTLKPKDFPAALVIWKLEDKDATGLEGRHVLASMTVVIRGVVYAETNLETAINYFLEDIEKVMCLDTDRGTYAEYTDPSRITVYQTEQIKFAIFDFDFTVVYQHLYGSP